VIGLRTLPIPLAPLPAELIGSYLNRLADANHLTIRWLTQQIGPGRHHHRDRDDLTGWTPRSTDRLAMLTGRTTTALMHAMPSLIDVSDLPPRPQLMIDSLIASWRAPACLLCAASRGVHGLAIQRTYPHQRICAQHGRWRAGGDQRMLHRQLPETLHANQRHRRLLRRHGLLRLNRSYDQAQELTARWLTGRNSPPELQQAWKRRLEQLDEDPYGDPSRPSPDRIELATYPETVTITGLVASRPDQTPEAFLTEVSHRLPFDARSIPDLLLHTKLPSSLRKP
jgi:TniQ